MTKAQKGDRIRLINMPDDPNPLPAGTTGTVQLLGHKDARTGHQQIFVKWDIDRSLILIEGVDEYEII